MSQKYIFQKIIFWQWYYIILQSISLRYKNTKKHLYYCLFGLEMIIFAYLLNPKNIYLH